MLTLADLGALKIGWVGGVAVVPIFKSPDEDLDGFVVASTGDQQAGGDRAALSSMDTRHGGPGKYRCQVGVVEHDVCGLAAQLEEHTLHRGRGRFHNAPPGRGRARKRHQIDARIRRQDLAGHVIRGGDNVEYACGNVGLLRDDLADMRRRPRCVGRRLEHEGAARSQCRADLGDIEIQRHVPGCDGPDYAGRLLAQQAALGLAQEGHVGHADFVLIRGGEICPVGHHLDRIVHVHVGGQGNGCAGLVDDDCAKLFFLFDQPFIELSQAAAAKFRVDRPIGFVEGAARDFDRAEHVVLGAVCGLPEYLSCGRIQIIERVAVAGVTQFTVDQISGFGSEGGQGHWIDPQTLAVNAMDPCAER